MKQTDRFFDRHGVSENTRRGIGQLRHSTMQVQWICQQILADTPQVLDSYWLVSRGRDFLKAAGDLADELFTLATLIRSEEHRKSERTKWDDVMSTRILTERVRSLLAQHTGDEFVTMQELFNLTAPDDSEEDNQDEADDGDE